MSQTLIRLPAVCERLNNYVKLVGNIPVRGDSKFTLSDLPGVENYVFVIFSDMALVFSVSKIVNNALRPLFNKGFQVVLDNGFNIVRGGATAPNAIYFQLCDTVAAFPFGFNFLARFDPGNNLIELLGYAKYFLGNTCFADYFSLDLSKSGFCQEIGGYSVIHPDSLRVTEAGVVTGRFPKVVKNYLPGKIATRINNLKEFETKTIVFTNPTTEQLSTIPVSSHVSGTKLYVLYADSSVRVFDAADKEKLARVYNEVEDWVSLASNDINANGDPILVNLSKCLSTVDLTLFNNKTITVGDKNIELYSITDQSGADPFLNITGARVDFSFTTLSADQVIAEGLTAEFPDYESTKLDFSITVSAIIEGVSFIKRTITFVLVYGNPNWLIGLEVDKTMEDVIIETRQYIDPNLWLSSQVLDVFVTQLSFVNGLPFTFTYDFSSYRTLSVVAHFHHSAVLYKNGPFTSPLQMVKWFDSVEGVCLLILNASASIYPSRLFLLKSQTVLLQQSLSWNCDWCLETLDQFSSKFVLGCLSFSNPSFLISFDEGKPRLAPLVILISSLTHTLYGTYLLITNESYAFVVSFSPDYVNAKWIFYLNVVSYSAEEKDIEVSLVLFKSSDFSDPQIYPTSFTIRSSPVGARSVVKVDPELVYSDYASNVKPIHFSVTL